MTLLSLKIVIVCRLSLKVVGEKVCLKQDHLITAASKMASGDDEADCPACGRQVYQAEAYLAGIMHNMN